MHDPVDDRLAFLTRRSFVSRTAHGVGSMALASLLAESILGGTRTARAATQVGGGLAGIPHFAPKAKRVLCLFQSEGFSHIDLFDPKRPCGTTPARTCPHRSRARSA